MEAARSWRGQRLATVPESNLQLQDHRQDCLLTEIGGAGREKVTGRTALQQPGLAWEGAQRKGEPS